MRRLLRASLSSVLVAFVLLACGSRTGLLVDEPIVAVDSSFADNQADVTPDQSFVLAVNNYRQSGGGGFPAVSTAEVVYNRQVEAARLDVADWLQDCGGPCMVTHISH